MLHVKLTHGSSSFSTVALIDSGATTTFIPTEMAEALGMNLTRPPSDAVGAGGTFSNIASELEKLSLVKGRTSIFDEFFNVRVWVPANEGTIPYMVLGRDHLFKRYDIEFEERNEKVTLTRHKP